MDKETNRQTVAQAVTFAEENGYRVAMYRDGFLAERDINQDSGQEVLSLHAFVGGVYTQGFTRLNGTTYQFLLYNTETIPAQW